MSSTSIGKQAESFVANYIISKKNGVHILFCQEICKKIRHPNYSFYTSPMLILAKKSSPIKYSEVTDIINDILKR